MPRTLTAVKRLCKVAKKRQQDLTGKHCHAACTELSAFRLHSRWTRANSQLHTGQQLLIGVYGKREATELSDLQYDVYDSAVVIDAWRTANRINAWLCQS